MSKPRVTTSCVANSYASADERIIEFSFPGADPGDGTGPPGGLIRFHHDPHTNACSVHVYRTDPEVKVTHAP